ncbi:MAG: hypothetical protein KAV82_10230 [Phycisphaerae bacterium]|nr:hypothetical protein [Phycisphaerae bacterium]
MSSRQESVHERIDALEAESRVHVAQSSRMQNLIALSGIVIVFVGLLIIVLDARRRLFAAASAVTGSPKGEASERKDII